MFHYAKESDYENRWPSLAEYQMAKKRLEKGMDKIDTLRKINELYDYAQKLEIELIESEARKILMADPDLDEFIMAMGRAFFTYKAGGKYDLFSYTDEELIAMEEGDDPRIEFIYGNNTGGLGNEGGIIHNENFQKEFFDMIDDMNSQSNVMGYPMRFTANGPVKNKW